MGGHLMNNAQSSISAKSITYDACPNQQSCAFLGTSNPRHLRVIYALIRGPRTRSEIDEIAGASNGPEVIFQLRRRGLSLPCARTQQADRDGITVWPGVYRLTDQDRQKLSSWLTLRTSNESVEEPQE